MLYFQVIPVSQIVNDVKNAHQIIIYTLNKSYGNIEITFTDICKWAPSLSFSTISHFVTLTILALSSEQIFRQYKINNI